MALAEYPNPFAMAFFFANSHFIAGQVPEVLEVKI
jgi:hypothetical protein